MSSIVLFQEDIEEKVRVIEIYNTRLTERERRRQFVMDRKLINVRKQQNLDRRRNPAERELCARLKAIARYLPQQEFEVLSEGAVTESRIRARIQVCSLHPPLPLSLPVFNVQGRHPSLIDYVILCVRRSCA